METRRDSLCGSKNGANTAGIWRAEIEIEMGSRKNDAASVFGNIAEDIDIVY